MPLVRIDLHSRKEADFAAKVGNIVYEAMIATINVPAADNFQLITEHAPGGIVFDPSYLGIQRSEGIIFIQITLNSGRTVEMKKALYALIASRLHAELGVRQEDVLISLIEVVKENWSFGNGIAQYA
jgi:phenylpyruvate tautomerase PptA (4-oxalocrotonate tautomerase family)